MKLRFLHTWEDIKLLNGCGNTALLKMIVGVLTTCHAQYT
jgi:ABC-type transport system involved in cytochrome c biogenesis ATPase subunit